MDILLRMAQPSLLNKKTRIDNKLFQSTVDRSTVSDLKIDHSAQGNPEIDGDRNLSILEKTPKELHANKGQED